MADHGRITITGFKWVPNFAQGYVRDNRLRWMLREVGWDYEVELIDGAHLATAEYRAEHPFGQVPLMREEGRATLFETGGIVLDIAERSGKLLPTDPDERALAKCWTYAALNSVEPFLLLSFIGDMMIEDRQAADAFRPVAENFATDRLEKLAAALGDKPWLVGDDFTIADLMMASVSLVSENKGFVDRFDNLVAWRERCFSRPACQEALAEQRAEYERHRPKDMGVDEAPADGG